MEVVNGNQWNGGENEVEEVSLQRKRILNHSSSSNSSSSDSDIETKDELSGFKDEGLDFDASKIEVIETKVNSEIDLPHNNAENGTETQVNSEIDLPHNNAENETILPVSISPFLEVSPPLSNVTSNERRTVIIIKENGNERQEFYLENVFEKPPAHGFYCPNCRSCIQKVFIQKEEVKPASVITQSPRPTEPRCSSCFSFLIPIGRLLFPGLIPNEDGASNDEVTGSSSNNRNPEGPETIKVASKPHQPEEVVKFVATGTTSETAVTTADGSGKQTSQNFEVQYEINGTGLEGIPSGNNNKLQDALDHLSDTQGTVFDPKKGEAATTKKHFWTSWTVKGGSSKTSDWKAIAKQPATDHFPDQKQPELVEVDIGASTGSGEEANPTNVDDTDRTPLLTSSEGPVTASNKTLEILKSVVYGGLTESLTSLSVITSAASADVTTLNIVALATANLIGGLLTLGHNLRELKADQPKRSNTNVPVDRYKELLGQRQNYILHAFFAILSFIIFGLVPPVVYGFSFKESESHFYPLKDLKLAAVAGASILCITLLSIAKAYTKRPNSFLTYFQTVVYYVSTGAVASVLSYLAGDLVKKLMERFGWFETESSNFGMWIPGSSVEQPGWGSY